MSSPQRKPKQPSVFNSPALNKANWLGRYLEVEGKGTNEIHAVLEMAERSIVNALASIGPDGPISSGIRKAQLNLALQSVRKILRGTFGSVTDIIRSKQAEAAVAAVDAGLFDDRGVMKLLFPHSVDRQNYADSLRETAQRNIQATVTRVIKTEQPLSARVWRTNALSNGLVSKAVNNALARGESAENLAKEIRHLVRPDAPGGISYAAMRLARTEINNAFHAQSIDDARKKPWVHQMRWNLSKVHKDDPGDKCEEYALQGLFDIDRVPNKPHPHCRCFVTAELPDYQQFEDNLVMGHYDSYLDSVMGEDYSANRGQPDRTIEPVAKVQQQYSPNAKLSDITHYDNLETPEQVATVLKTRFPGLQVDNFTSNFVGTEEAREIARGIDQMMQLYPESGLKQVVVGDGPEGEWARTIRDTDGKSIIKWNMKYSKDSQEFGMQSQIDEASGFHTPQSGARPYYSTTVHEFGHVIDNDGNQMARMNVQDSFLSAIEEASVPETDEALKLWYETNSPSLYSLERNYVAVGGWSPNDGEALAEAFCDVVMNGDDAKPLSKTLYQIMIDEREGNFQRAVGVEQTWSSSIAMLDKQLVTFDKYDNVGDIAIVLNNQFGVDVDSDLGFNDADMDLKVAKELANQFAVLQDKYPEIQIHQMSNDDLIDDTVFAITYPASGGGSTMQFNRKYMSSYADFAQAEYQSEIEIKYNKKGEPVVDKLAVGFHPAGVSNEPAKSVLTHEWGHAIDNFIMGYGLNDWDSTEPILDLLWNDYKGISTGFPELLEKRDFPKWWGYLRKNLSGYSFEDKARTSVNRAEALAEAFDDVERNGEKAMHGSKLLYQYLMNKRDEALEERNQRVAYQAAKRLGRL